MTEVMCSSCRTRNRVPIDARGIPRCPKCHSDLPWLAEADEQTLDLALSTSKLPVLVDLWAPWCGPCRSIAPILETLAVERAGALRIVKVNVDESPSVSARLGVQGIPTMVLFENGVEVSRQVGALPAAGIKRWIDSSLTGE